LKTSFKKTIERYESGFQPVIALHVGMERKLKTSFRIYFPLSTSGLYTISDHKLFIYPYVFRHYRCLTVMDEYLYFAEITLLCLYALCLMVLNQDCGTTETDTDLTRDSFSMSGSRFGLTQIERYLQTLLSTDPKLILT
jgi:hypothetical protein